MAQYDGSIRIGTEISTKAAKKSLGTLSNMITLTAKEISSLRSKMNALKGQKFYTDDYKKLQSDLTDAEKKFADYSSLIQSSSIKNENQQKAVNEQLEKYEDEIESIKGKMQALEDAGKAFTLGGDTTEYANYERQLQYEQAALEEETKQYQALDKLKDPYGRLSQALTDLNGKLSSILRPIQKIQSAFAQDVKVSGYEKLESSLGELGGIAIRVAETVKNTFVTLKQGKQGVVAVIHSLSSSLMNMANTVNSAIGSVLGNGLEKLGDGIGAVVEKIKIMATGIGSAISSAAKIVLEKLAGLVGNGLNLILHPFKTLKNVATTTLGGIANIIKGVLGSALEGLKKRAAGLAASIINGIVHPFQTLKKIGGSAVKGVTKLFSGMITVAKKAGKAISSIASILKRAASSMLGFGKSAQKSNSTLGAFGSRFKSLALSLLIFNQISKAFNAMISGMKEGFGNLYKEVGGFKSAIDGLKASTLTLKNSFAAAFRPLVEVAVPYIQKAIDAIANLMNIIGQFTAAITGQKTYTKAIKQTTAAIEDENKAQNKQLSGLDKLNNLSSGGGGGAGGGASDQMFEENAPISSRFEDIAQQLKDMWENADFTDLGKILGDKLKSALENIPWDSIQQTVTKVGKSFATLINGFVEVPKLGYTIGKSIGEAINTGIELSNNFFDNMHWDSLGKFFGEGFNGIIESIKWKDLGHNLVARFRAIVITAINFLGSINFGSISNGLSEFVIGIFDSLSDLIAEIEWSKLPRWIIDSISDFFKGFDYKGVFGSIGKLVATAVVAGIDLISALGKVLADIGTKVKDFFVKKFKEAGWSEDGGFIENGKAIIDGLLNGILEGIAGIGKWIYENIFKPFIDGFKDAFGIHSPSTVMAEMGNFLMEGLFNGISALIDNIISIFTTIKEKISEVWEKVKQVTSDIWKSIKQKINDAWNGIKSLVSTAINNVKTTISNVWNTIKNTTTNVWNGIKGIFNGFMTFLTGVFTGNWKKAWSGIISVFEGVRDNIKSIINGILGLIESLANGVIDGINFVIGALNGLSFDIPDWVPLIGGETFGFNIPELSQVSIPRLATGTVVPPNNEFLAVLGDNKREPEVVSPLSTIEQAVENAMRRNGGMGGGEVTIKIPVEIDGRVLFELMKKFDLEQYRRTGRPSFQM